MAFDDGELHLQAPVKIRLRERRRRRQRLGRRAVGSSRRAGRRASRVRASRRRWAGCCSTRRCREDYRFVNYEMPQEGQLSAIVNDLAERYPKVQVAATLDALKEAGFHWATRSGVTIAIDDVVAPPNKQEILDRYEKEADQDRQAVPARCRSPTRSAAAS